MLYIKVLFFIAMFVNCVAAGSNLFLLIYSPNVTNFLMLLMNLVCIYLIYTHKPKQED